MSVPSHRVWVSRAGSQSSRPHRYVRLQTPPPSRHRLTVTLRHLVGWGHARHQDRRPGRDHAPGGQALPPPGPAGGTAHRARQARVRRRAPGAPAAYPVAGRQRPVAAPGRRGPGPRPRHLPGAARHRVAPSGGAERPAGREGHHLGPAPPAGRAGAADRRPHRPRGGRPGPGPRPERPDPFLRRARGTGPGPGRGRAQRAHGAPDGPGPGVTRHGPRQRRPLYRGP